MAGKKGVGNIAMWILMGLLIIGLGGFSVGNFGGSVRAIGAVGETPIDLNDYARALQSEIQAESAARGAPLSFAQAQADQVDQRVMAQLIAQASLEEEARVMGVSIGDANLRDQLMQIRGFQGLDGEFDREAYRFSVENSGMTEAEFEQSLRSEASRSLLQGAVVAGVDLPGTYAETLMTYFGQRRTITWAMLDRDDLITGLPDPDEQDLITYHQSHLPDFTTPETKDITYAWLTPEMIIDTVEVDEDSLRAAYEDRTDEFNQPERRLVERLAFADAAAADSALERITSDDAGFDDLVTERGLDLADVDLGDVSLEDLGEAGAAIFAADAGAVVGPLPTAIGPALFRINGVLQAQNTTFDEAQPMLRDELAGDRARRVIDAQIDAIDDLLAAGATVEELANDTDMQIGQISWHPGMTEDIGAYDAFRVAAAAISTSDFPEIEKLEDEGIFAMRLNAVVEPEILPLDEVRAQAEAGWRAETIVSSLREQATPALEPLKTGAPFGDHNMAQTTTLEVTRSTFQPEAPSDFIDTVFGMEDGEVRILDGEARIFVMRLDSIAPPDPEDQELARLRDALSNDAANGLATDIYQALANDIRVRNDITLDQSAINAVHSNFQ
ncbi:MAG: peptidylprolyl isomerase [Roseovarius sp.]